MNLFFCLDLIIKGGKSPGFFFMRFEEFVELKTKEAQGLAGTTEV